MWVRLLKLLLSLKRAFIFFASLLSISSSNILKITNAINRKIYLDSKIINVISAKLVNKLDFVLYN